ncbi:glycoside hydrolase family 31 protein [Tetragenococcus koreensis]|uniref:glycoside hydrolase family 31 protein n=1 Tax=Tetragenococcus koreensis TaxID=290335 RepID=UPI000F511ECD|nr:TIM-barrel domain-containing protein [Tetragenococcus koreensis]MDN6630814.1 family 31 glucosidase [Staphylococcus equorum]MDN6731432.1 glycoside hydrolase family 31 protein [Atopostipes suicloacalis]AYW46531.1 family 31 glucosidase [Tetragenococcus koreensis]MCF1585355.1 glycoside hydrolase family 31 protein [Tetragenococcus koreensis]MCF1619741.1 glycoside hydrolase family 31 protein [Tetragenococcus koreensis]
MIKVEDNYIEKRYDNELLIIEPWGANSLRVRSFLDQKKTERKNALTEEAQYDVSKVKTFFNDEKATIVNGKIKATLDHRDRLTFYNDKDEILLEEFIRLRAVKHDDGSEDVGTVEITKDFNSTLKLKSREYRANNDGPNFHTKVRFESNKKEKIYGMGQYQHPYLDLKNTMLELAQRNSQMSIPFYVSSKNYGFLWNNPGIGKVTFAKNLTEWEMFGTDYIDYWITAGETPKEITEQYTSVTGRSPEMPENLLGLWQSKLRYRTPEEVLEVVEGYHKRGIQLSTIAIDYFHWPKQGEYRFDKDFWPDPESLIRTLKKDYGVEPVISIWPTVQSDAYNYEDYLQGGYLVKVNRGIRLTMQIQGNTVYLDTTNPEARDYVWSLIKKNYKDIGIDYYWVDVAEPGYAVYDFDNYRYYAGTALEVGNLYPNEYLKMVYEGNKDTNDAVVTLVRGSWAGAQKYGALAWSGDIDSSFEAFNNQVNTGLNMGMAGIPWWTTDIGGFHGGNPKDPEFQELMVRWFQYSTFSPVLRMHGDRLPHSEPLSDSGGGSMPTGEPNEIWSYGDEVENILTKYVEIRECLKDYLSKIMEEAHKYGYPVMRTLFYEFPEDENSWEVDNTYLLGSDILVAPIMNYEDRSRKVYLPDNENWIHLYSGQEFEGGSSYDIEASLEQIPIFIRKSASGQFKELLAYAKNNFN